MHAVFTISSTLAHTIPRVKSTHVCLPSGTNGVQNRIVRFPFEELLNHTLKCPRMAHLGTVPRWKQNGEHGTTGWDTPYASLQPPPAAPMLASIVEMAIPSASIGGDLARWQKLNYRPMYPECRPLTFNLCRNLGWSSCASREPSCSMPL